MAKCHNVGMASTFCAYMLVLKTHLLPVFGGAETITEDDAQQFVFDKLRGGLSRKTVQDMMAVLKSVVKFGTKHGIYRYEPWDLVHPNLDQKRRCMARLDRFMSL